MMNRGEITTQQIITIIILVMSFAVILYFILALDLGGTTNKEICHNSVVMAGKSGPLGGGVDCKTNYVCISAGGDCEGMDESANVKVNPENKEEVLKIIADEMADCWWMFGDGKVKYLSGDWIGERCAVCAVVEFSEGFEGEIISLRGFYNYLNTKEYGGGSSATYLKYLYSINEYEKLFYVKNFGKDLNKGNFPKYLNSGRVYSNKVYLIVTGLNPELSNPEPEDFVPVQFVEQDLVKYETVCDSFDVSKA